MLTYQTAGESHGKGLAALVDGFPAGVPLDSAFIDAELRRRQGGYGRGGRQKIETDSAEILTGIWRGASMGAPILLWVKNRDYKIDDMPTPTQPRPGHGDLTGSMKYGQGIRPILERSSARETAARVAAGALAKLLLRELEIDVVGFVSVAVHGTLASVWIGIDYKVGFGQVGTIITFISCLSGMIVRVYGIQFMLEKAFIGIPFLG